MARSQRLQENVPDPALEPGERRNCFQMDWVGWQLTEGHPVNGMFLLPREGQSKGYANLGAWTVEFWPTEHL